MKYSISKKILFILILLLLSIFSNGQYVVFFAIWIFMAMLLFVSRKSPRWPGFILVLLLTSISSYIGFDFVPFMPLLISIISSLIFGLFASLPYLIDSCFLKKRHSFLSTLIFPCLVVLFEYAYHQFNSYGTFGHLAYTQQSQLILIQSVSVFGLGYITFLIAWFASVSNWIYEQRNEWKNIKKAILIYSFVMGFTLVYGSYRLQFQKPISETIRIASISALDSLQVAVDVPGLNNEETKEDLKIKTRRNTSELNQYLFDKSIKEANAGAKIVFWAEGNGTVLKEDEQKLYKKASQTASNHDIYLGIAIAVFDHTNPKYLENKFILFDNDGNIIIDYWKGISVPGVEAPISNNKTTGIQKVETDYGIISGVICFDLDFPNYLKQAKGSDIFLAPSNDWKEIDPIHTDMSKFRAIEQGFNFIRQTSFGLSIGTDYTGKVISEMDHYTAEDKVLITQLPTKGITTIYSKIGDIFIGFCLLSFISSTIILRRKQNCKN